MQGWQEQQEWNQQHRQQIRQIRKERFEQRRRLQASKREELQALVYPAVVEEVMAPKSLDGLLPNIDGDDTPFLPVCFVKKVRAHSKNESHPLRH